MILTCPECATGYFVQDGQIGPGGRTVRCAACGARWTAYADAPLDLVPPDQDATADSGAGGAPPEDAPAAADDLPRAFRGRAEEEKRLKRATTAGVAWAGAAVAVAALLAGAVLMRESVVRAWPMAA